MPGPRTQTDPLEPVWVSVETQGWRKLDPLDARSHAREPRVNESGQSRVWMVENSDGTRGVIKVPKLSEAQKERLRREVRVLATIEHPAVVQVLASDTSSGTPWLITPLGQPLVAWWKDRTWSEHEQFEEARRLILELADGLDLVHRSGIIHRDIKPENVVIFERQGRDQPALIDFGLAHVRDKPRLTHIDGRAVANQFAAPPQAYYGPLDDPPPWWDCLGLAWLWGWLIAPSDEAPKGGRYHWKYQPLLDHPKSQLVRAFIAVCSNEATAPRGIREFQELAKRLGIGRMPTGARRTSTAFADIAQKHAAAEADRALRAQARREEVEAAVVALGTMYEGVIRDLEQVVADVAAAGLKITSSDMFGTHTIFDALDGLSVGDNTILWHCEADTHNGPFTIRLLASYHGGRTPADAPQIWPVRFEIRSDPRREIPYAKVVHRTDGAPLWPDSLAVASDDALARALEWILQAEHTWLSTVV